jgi:uncharacterized protein YbaR (Trm112 family)
MPADSAHPFQFNPIVIEQLACPVCQGNLQMDEARLVCAGCGRAYPIVDGIPVLIAGREESSRS